MSTAKDDLVLLDGLDDLHTLVDGRSDRFLAQDVVPLIGKDSDGLCMASIHDGDDDGVGDFTLGGQFTPVPKDEMFRDRV